MSKIAVIGLGNMGLPMAGNLAKAQHHVIGYDLVAANVAKADERGVKAAKSAADAVKDAEIVITMLPAGKHVLGVYEEILSAAKKGTLFIDCSTIDVGSARIAHEMASKAGMVPLDAPVSGGTGGAEAATLTFMVGGDEAAVKKATPVLENMGKKVVHCGDAGAGQVAKVCNNMILGVTMIGVSEAFILGEKLGLSPQKLFDVVSTATGQCWAVNTYAPVAGLTPNAPSNRGFTGGFANNLMLKDMKLSQEASAAAGVATPLGAAATQLYALANAYGEGGKDFSAIIETLRGRK
jgi:3-hydroxyisobutyrate dehydrogenase